MKILTITDLHQRAVLYRQLEEVVREHKPDVVAAVGDFLDATEDTDGKISLEECAATFARLQCPEVLFVPGNHEGMALWQFREEFTRHGREFRCLEGDAMVIQGVAIVGFPCFIGGYSGIFREVPDRADEWLGPLIQKHGAAAKELWLMHEGPADNPKWRRAIDRFRPKVVIHGHEHERDSDQITTGVRVINSGQSMAGPLRYLNYIP
jgi:Icc-related predicted phosphoesterase